MTEQENEGTASQRSPVQSGSLVRYYPVRLRGVTIGYLFAGTAEARAGLIVVLEALDVGPRMKAVATWSDRLKAGAAEGFAPLEALERWKGAPEDPLAGAVPGDAELQECVTLADLEQLANPGYVPPPSPNPQGSPYHRQRDWGPVVTKLVDTGYPMAASGSVRYRPVWLSDMVIGFLWASEEENALGYVARREARATGNRARGWWIRAAATLARRGLSAPEALRARVGLLEDPRGGRLDVSDEERVAGSTEELKEIARGPWPPES